MAKPHITFNETYLVPMREDEKDKIHIKYEEKKIGRKRLKQYERKSDRQRSGTQ